jgi:lysophospholipase L1-like esterase
MNAAKWIVSIRIVQSPDNPASERANFIAARWNLARDWVCCDIDCIFNHTASSTAELVRMAQSIVSLLFRWLATATVVVCLQTAGFAQDSAALNWFRSDVQEGAASAWYRWAIDPAVANSESAELTMVTDGHCSLYVNGQRILKNVAFQKSGDSVTALGFDVKSLLRQGRNTVAVEVHSADKVALFGICISAVRGDQKTAVGGVWHVVSVVPPVGWQQTDFNDRDWPEARAATGEPGDRFTVATPEKFAAPVLPAKVRTAPFQFEDGDHVVFVGATFFERAQLSEHLEAMLAGACGEKHVTFRNLGWSADTVFADSRGIFDKSDVGYLRMVEHIRAEEPTVAIICYGQNEALTSGMTPEKYSHQLGVLLDELAASGIACVLVSPHELLPTLPPIPSPARFNSKIKVYSEATSSVAQSRGLLFVDLFSNFANQMREIDYEINSCYKLPPDLERQTDNPDTLARVIYRSFSENGMHLTDHGYACASAIVRERLLEIPAALPVVVVDPKSQSVESDAVNIRNVKWNKDGTKLLTFELRQKSLTGLPTVISIAGEDAKSISVNRVTIQSGDTAEPLIQRSFLAFNEARRGRSFATQTNPQYEALRQLLLKKNELYFHRWRPQNITYLFGFRKHEQGNNAADIAKFDPFILELERQIHELQQPQWRQVTLKLQ